MNNKIQIKMVAEALSQHTQKKRPVSKKIISTLMSVCTAFSKPKDDLGLEQWREIEFKKPKFSENSEAQSWRSL